MSGVHQNGVVPGNVIDFRFTSDVDKDSENLNNLVRDGSMIQANPYTFNDGCCFIRYDPSNLKFMRFDIAKECMWVTTKNPVEDMITILQRGATPKAPFFMKGSDLAIVENTGLVRETQIWWGSVLFSFSCQF